jgi:hypothetical protein
MGIRGDGRHIRDDGVLVLSLLGPPLREGKGKELSLPLTRRPRLRRGRLGPSGPKAAP